MRLLSASDLGSKFFVDIKLAPGGESELGPSGFQQPSATAQLGFPDILRRSITVFRYMAKPQAVSEVSGFLLNLYRDSDASRTLGTSRVCLYYSSQSLGCLGSSVHMRSGPAHPHWLAQDEVFSPAARAVLPKPLRITELRQASSGKSRLKSPAELLGCCVLQRRLCSWKHVSLACLQSEASPAVPRLLQKTEVSEPRVLDYI